jgi:hypothetical protein
LIAVLKEFDIVFKSFKKKIRKMEAYCMKCKEKREMTNAEEVVTDKGIRMAKGQCSVCNTKMCKILGKVKPA